MTTKRRLEYLLNTVMLAIFLATVGAQLGRGQAAVSPPQEAKNAVGFNEFLDRVQAYAYFPYTVAKDVADFRNGDFRQHGEI